MLLEFACSNHKSIRKEILFSAMAGSNTSLKENIHEIPAGRVLKSAVIYGPNGSGKSNFIDAIAFVQNLVRTSIHNQIGQGILYSPHKSDGFFKESTYKFSSSCRIFASLLAFPCRTCSLQMNTSIVSRTADKRNFTSVPAKHLLWAINSKIN